MAVAVSILYMAAPFARAASTDSIRIEAGTDETEHALGDAIPYMLTVQWRQPIEIDGVEPAPEFERHELRAPEVGKEVRLRDGWRRKVYRYSFSVYETGPFELPPFTVLYRDAQGELQQQTAPPVTVEIQSVLPDDATTPSLREAKPPVMPPLRVSWLALAIVGAIAAVFAAVALFLLARYLRRKVEESRQVPPRPIEEIARERLAQVVASGLLEEQRIKDYFDQVSDIIREYLGQRYGFDGITTTTSELLEALREPLDGDGRLDLVARFSDEADMAKFAKWRPTRPVCDRFLQEAYRVIDETTPPPVVVEPQTAEGESHSTGTPDGRAVESTTKG
jgi:hypothetical protein